MFGSLSPTRTIFLLHLFHFASASFVSITNPSFESDSVSCVDNAYRSVIPSGWDLYDPYSVNPQRGVAEPKGGTLFDDSQFPDNVPDGSLCAYLNTDDGDSGEFGFMQTLTGNIITGDTKYILSAWVGNTAPVSWRGYHLCCFCGGTYDVSGFPGYRVQLLADDDVILAEDDDQLTIAESYWEQSTVSVTISSDDPNIGKTLKIRLINKNVVPLSGPLDWYDVDFDYVQLEEEPVTKSPSLYPTLYPSTFPTAYPTVHPTLYPTTYPSVTPSAYPTVYPSLYPTSYPTLFPSLYPTAFPTLYPSIYPTTYPSLYPTTYPTLYPSVYPTVYPTTYPTLYPSAYPTKYPSLYPTAFPTLHPSVYPTTYPSAYPSVYPSVYPTLYPTLYPTAYPSVYPSFYPSTQTIQSARSSYPTLSPTQHQETTTTNIEAIISSTRIEETTTTNIEETITKATTTVEDGVVIEATNNKEGPVIYHSTTDIIEDANNEQIPPSTSSIDGRSMGIGIAITLFAFCIVGSMALFIFQSTKKDEAQDAKKVDSVEEQAQVCHDPDDEKEVTLGARIADIASDSSSSDSGDGIYGTKGLVIEEKKEEKADDSDASMSDGMYVKHVSVQPGTPACINNIANESSDSNFDKLDMWENGNDNEGGEGEREREGMITVEGDNDEDENEEDLECEHITIGDPTDLTVSTGDADGMK